MTVPHQSCQSWSRTNWLKLKLKWNKLTMWYHWKRDLPLGRSVGLLVSQLVGQGREVTRSCSRHVWDSKTLYNRTNLPLTFTMIQGLMKTSGWNCLVWLSIIWKENHGADAVYPTSLSWYAVGHELIFIYKSFFFFLKEPRQKSWCQKLSKTVERL